MKENKYFIASIFNPKDKKSLTDTDKKSYFDYQVYDFNHPMSDDLGYIHFKSELSMKLWKHLKKVKK